MVKNWPKLSPRFPWVTLVLFLLCGAAKLLHSGLSVPAQLTMMELAGMLPIQVAAIFSRPVMARPDYQLLTLFSALFVHASWLHFVGNMVYLWVFGIPLERRLGWFGMLAVFMFGGALANLIVALRLPELATPIIGASGAVSVVIGAYLSLLLASRIGMLLPLGLILQFACVPAVLVIGS